MFSLFESSKYFEEYMDKDVYNSELPFMQNNPYIVVYTRYSNPDMLIVNFSGVEYLVDYNSSGIMEYFSFKNDFSNKITSLILITFEKTYLGCSFGKSSLKHDSAKPEYIPFIGESITNFQEQILYSNFDIRDIEGKVLFPATEKTHNTPLPPTDERKVSWTSFGNRTTAKGEYLPLGNSAINFKLYTGNIDGHKYGAYMQEYNNSGQKVGDLIAIDSAVFSNTFNAHTTYDLSINLMGYAQIQANKKYVFHLLDATSAEYVSSIGFTSMYTLPHIPLPPNADTITSTENDKTDSEVVPYPPGGFEDPFDEIPEIPNSDGLEGINDKILWFFTTIINAMNMIVTLFGTLLNSVVSLSSSFVAFLGSAFSYLPSELVALLSLSLVAIIVMRFMGRQYYV